VYRTGGTIRHLDTRTGRDRSIASGVDSILAAQASALGDGVGIAYRLGDSTRVVAVDAETGAVTVVHEGSGAAGYTMAWSPDGRRLGVGIQGVPSAGIREAESGTVRDMGCQAANRFAAWRSRSQAIVHDRVNFYAVGASDCATLTTVSKTGKIDPQYAPSGTRMAFYQNRSVAFANRPQPEIVPELWIADYDGGAARVISDYQSRPRNSFWSPGGERIVYEVVSRRWASTTHLITYAVTANDYSYIAEENALGVPNDFNACWSPDGRRIAHDRTYARSTGAQAYTTREVVVRRGTGERVVLDEVIGEPQSAVVAATTVRCRWVGPRHLLVSTRDGQRVLDVDDGETHAIPADRVALAVKVFDHTP
jgi:dipeptidyl aminopeptidase/acylaminoacyl peptidase